MVPFRHIPGRPIAAWLSGPALLLLALLLFSAPASAQTQEEKDLSKKAVAALMKNADAIIINAAQAYTDGQYAQTIRLLTPLVRHDPEQDAAWYYLGMSKLYLRDYTAGIEDLRKAAALDPANYWYRYYLNLALTYYADDPAEGIEGYEALLADYPTRSDLAYQLADIYMRKRETEKALELMARIEESFGRDENLAMMRYELLSSTGREDEAVQVLLDLNAQSPSAFVLNEIGTFYQAHEKDSLAREAFSEALRLNPGDLTATQGLADAHLALGDEDAYFALMRKTLESEDTPVSFSTRYLRNQSSPFIRRQFSRPERIDSLAELLLSVHPADTAVLKPVGYYYNTIDRPDEATACFRRSAALYPHDWDTNLLLIQYFFYKENFAEASAAAGAAFEANPDDTRYLELKSYSDYKRGDYDALIANNEKLMRISEKGSETYVQALAGIGDIYHETGRDKEAFATYERVLKIDPDYVPTLNNYAYYLSVKGKKLKKAYRMSRRSIELEPDNATYLDTFGWILHLQGKDVEAKPVFKQAMLYGGQDSAVILDHYAVVLNALGEKDLARLYWRQALTKAESDSQKADITAKLSSLQ